MFLRGECPQVLGHDRLLVGEHEEHQCGVETADVLLGQVLYTYQVDESGQVLHLHVEV